MVVDMTIGELRRLISDLPGEAGVRYNNPYFSGPYDVDPEKSDFFVEGGELFVKFPLEYPVD